MVTPELDRALAADLRDLVADLGTDDHTRTSLVMLEHHLHRSVPSALGLTLVLPAVLADAPVRVHLLRRTLRPEDVSAVLEIALSTLLPEAAGTVVLYAAHPRAFAHLGEALGLLPDELAGLPGLTQTLVPGIEGLHDRTTLDRGLGVLLNRGHDLAGARVELQHQADESRTDLATAARALLRA